MKTKILSILACAAAMLGFSACDDTFDPGRGNAAGEGQLNTASILCEVSNAEIIVSDNGPQKAPGHRAVYDTTNFLITVTDANDVEVANWVYSNMPSLPTFPVGTYTLKVRSHNVDPVAWNEPYFTGEQTFQITDGEVTEVPTVVCRLANIRVSVVFTDDLLEACASDVKVTVTSTDGHSIDFSTTETRSAYFEAEEALTTLAVKFTGTVSGTAENFEKALTDVAAGQHRKVTFSLKKNGSNPPDEFGNIGGSEGINVSTDITSTDLTADNPVEEEILPDNDRPGSDEGADPDQGNDPDPGTDPGTTPEQAVTFTSDNLDLNGLNLVSDFADANMQPIKDAIVDIAIPAGCANLLVEIISDQLTDEMLQGVGLAATFDLAYPGSLASTLHDNFGFPVGDDVIGAPSLQFNITNFVPLLSIYAGNEHDFRITVTDAEGHQASQLLRFQS